jgi:hypothetical protein
LNPALFQDTLEEPMEKEHFKILREALNNYSRQLIEGINAINRRLDRMIDRLDRMQIRAAEPKFKAHSENHS